MNQHPTPDRLRQWREGFLCETERQEIETHLEGCPDVCQTLLDVLSEGVTPLSGPFRRDGQTGSAAPPSPDGYEILREIGRGGMAVVYEARQRSLDRMVALKMLLLGDQAGPEDLTRFRSEAETIARMHHPNIVQVYEIGEHRGRMFLSLEHCPGGTLAERLNGGSPSPTDAAALVESLARAVHHAHVQGVLHRDLKPANVLLVEGPKVPVSRCTPKISDFGLAKRLDLKHPHSQSGTIIGTPSYMAPEQALGKRSELGPEADVYGLGAILYECLTGRPPFQAEQPLDTILQVIADEPVAVRRRRPKVHLDLETICMKCLEKSPRARYSSALALADDLRRFLDGEEIQARRPSIWRHGGRWLRRRGAWAAAAMLVLAAIAVGGSILLAKNSRERDRIAFATARESVKHILTRFDANNLVGGDNRIIERMHHELTAVVPTYEQLLKHHSDDPEIRSELALILVRTGWLEVYLNNREAALASIEKGRSQFTTLVTDHPDRSKYRQGLADANSDLAFVSGLLGQNDKARIAYETALQERKQLVADYPDMPEHHWELGQEKLDFARFLQARGEIESAAKLLEGVTGPRGIFERGALQAQLGRTDEADKTFGDACAFIEAYAAPGVPTAKRQQKMEEDLRAGKWSVASSTAAKLTDLMVWSSQLPLSVRGAISFYAQLVSTRPTELHLKHRLARLWFYHAMFLFKESRNDSPELKEALGSAQRGISLYRELLKDNPMRLAHSLEAAQLCSLTAGQVHQRIPDDDAMKWCEEALRRLDAATQLPRNNDEKAKLNYERAFALLARASVLDSRKRYVESVRDFQRAFAHDPVRREEFARQYASTVARAREQMYRQLRIGQVAEAVTDAEVLVSIPCIPGEALYDAACVFGVAARAESAPEKRERLEARCVEFLSRAFAAGFGKDDVQKATGIFGDPVEHLKHDKDLDSVRHRADYRKLLEELTRKP